LLPEQGTLSAGFLCLHYVSGPSLPLARSSLGSDFIVAGCGSLQRNQELTGVRDYFGPLLSHSLPAILSKNKTVIRPPPSFTSCLVGVCEAHWKWKVQIKEDAKSVTSNFTLHQKIKGTKCLLSATY